MKDKRFVNAEELAQEIGISKPFAYKIIREMNAELKKSGFRVIAGRVSRKYFEEKFYGFKESSEKKVM